MERKQVLLVNKASGEKVADIVRGERNSALEELARVTEERDNLQAKLDEAVDKALALAKERDALREKLERSIALPLDADGVPIHMGDYLSSDEYNGERFVCMGLDVEVRGESEHWSVGKRFDADTGCVEYTAARRCHHVSKRTVEDVLSDAGVSIAAVSDVAAEIRELMGADE